MVEFLTEELLYVHTNRGHAHTYIQPTRKHIRMHTHTQRHTDRKHTHTHKDIYPPHIAMAMFLQQEPHITDSYIGILIVLYNAAVTLVREETNIHTHSSTHTHTIHTVANTIDNTHKSTYTLLNTSKQIQNDKHIRIRRDDDDTEEENIQIHIHSQVSDSLVFQRLTLPSYCSKHFSYCKDQFPARFPPSSLHVCICVCICMCICMYLCDCMSFLLCLPAFFFLSLSLSLYLSVYLSIYLLSLSPFIVYA